MPAAGVPWFVTLFGRDSLIAALQTLPIHYPFALGALKKLGEYQADGEDDFRDMELGKILHEIRFGELAHFKKIFHTLYFGTHDATLLYILLLSETYKWMGNKKLLEELRPVLERCLAWIDRYGDRDGDGFLEYATRSLVGYRNQGWKDAEEAVVYPDGRLVDPPIALCELQGYAYDAKLRAAEIFALLGEEERAKQLRQEAKQLYDRFNELFWMEEEGFYAFGLDSKKEQIKTIASNPGHLLWSGIVPKERAAKVVLRLMAEDMFSGWGIRTLSSKNPAYNSLSYQNGSVWPHDNAIIASGFKRYGFIEEAQWIAKGVFDAAAYFDSYRLPELFAGIRREPYSFPVEHLGANIPLAWAAGSVFMLLTMLLGMKPDAAEGTLRVNPTLPDWLSEIVIKGMKIGQSRLSIRCWREGTQMRHELFAMEGRSFRVEDTSPP